MSRILIISPHPKVHETARKAAIDREDVVTVHALLENAIPIARKAETDGVEVIISRGGTSSLLERSNITIPIVDLPVSSLKLLDAITNIKRKNCTITVLGHGRIISDVAELKNILDVDIEAHKILSRREAEEYVSRRMVSSKPIEVLLGGAVAELLAAQYAIPTEFLETNLQDIEAAITEADRLIALRRRESVKTEQFKAILNNINNGVIAVDADSIITLFNKSASQITQVPQSQAEGRPLSEVFQDHSIQSVLQTGRPQLGKLINFGKVTAISNTVPVITNKKIRGAVETIEDISRIHEYETIIRSKMIEKGYVARILFADIIGESPQIGMTRNLARKYADVDSTVLISGESGSGKEVFAQAIHNASSRKEGPFVAVNCGAIPDSLIESELFGYKPGAFSGAIIEGKDGLFVQAQFGTIFLDEVSETSLSFQTTLLRVLQEMEVRPLGSDKVVPIDVRVIAATNKDIWEEVESGTFRSDLYYRLNILRLAIPPLRHRQGDIAHLITYFVEQISKKIGKRVTITSDSINKLKDYTWPGNIRELQNIIERLCVTCDGEISTDLIEVSLDDLDLYHWDNQERVSVQKKKHIKNVLKQCGNNKTMAAKKLGISRSTLWRAINEMKES